jgi:hypothetical protein
MALHPSIVDVTVKSHLDGLTYGTSFHELSLSYFLGTLSLALYVKLHSQNEKATPMLNFTNYVTITTPLKELTSSTASS